MMQADNHLADLLSEIRVCRVCRDTPTDKPMEHEPRPVLIASQTARILIAGQAPGTRVHASGVPFTDASGDRLRHWLGVTSEQFYDPQNFAILPMGFCFPGLDAQGGDLPPRKECAPLWRAKVLGLMPQVELILLIGGYAQKWHLGPQKDGLTATVIKWRDMFESSHQPGFLPLPHPSWRNTGWLKQNTWFETELLPVLRQTVMTLLN